MERRRKYVPDAWPQAKQRQKVEKKSIPHLMPHVFLPPTPVVAKQPLYVPLPPSVSIHPGLSDRRGDGPGCRWST